MLHLDVPISLGMVLAYAGMDESYNVSWLPSYGPEMRGGTAYCTVVVSDQLIGSPIIPSPRALVVLNRPSLDKFGPQLAAMAEFVTPDRRTARVFVSIYGSEEQRAESLVGLRAAAGYLKRELGHRLRLKYTPELSFVHDEDLQRYGAEYRPQAIHTLDIMHVIEKLCHYPADNWLQRSAHLPLRGFD